MKANRLAEVVLVVATMASACLAFAQVGAGDGIVTGRVLNSDGTPAVGVDIGLLGVAGATCVAGPYAIAVNQGSLSMLSAHARTDGDGRYRIPNLPAGRYYLATGRFWIPQGGGGQCYFPRRGIISQPIFLPGVTELSSATVVAVGSGPSPVPDFLLPAGPVPKVASFRVGGRVVGPPVIQDGEVLQVRMSAVDSRQSPCETFAANVGPDGAFELRDIPPCTYAVEVRRFGGDYSFSAFPSSAAKTLQVIDKDVIGLALGPGTTGR